MIELKLYFVMQYISISKMIVYCGIGAQFTRGVFELVPIEGNSLELDYQCPNPGRKREIDPEREPKRRCTGNDINPNRGRERETDPEREPKRRCTGNDMDTS